MNWKRSVFMGLVLLWGSWVSAQDEGAPPEASPAVQRLVEATNQVRSERGMQPLRWDSSLAAAARAHAELMVEQGQLSHQYDGEPDLTARAAQAGAHFRAIAENVAMGPSANAIQKEWMQSTAHRNNILDPQMTVLGIAVVEKRGYLYAVEDFANGVSSMSPPQVEEKIGALLRDRGLTANGAKQDARQTCEMQAGIAGGSHPGAVVRWQGPDISKLPAVLEQRIQGGHYRSAAVGACTSTDPQQGFTTYRVAVLLY